MNSKKKTVSTPNAALLPESTSGKVYLTERSHPLDVRSSILNPLYQDPTTILVDVPRKILILDYTKTTVDPTEAFKTIVSDITKALLFIISPISYETDNMILHLEDLN